MTTEDVRIEVLRSLRDKLIEDLPRRCGDGGDSYLAGVEVALRHVTDEINQRVAWCIATPLPNLRAELTVVMQLAVDKWLDDDAGDPATRAARAREVALKAIETAEAKAANLAKLVLEWNGLCVLHDDATDPREQCRLDGLGDQAALRAIEAARAIANAPSALDAASSLDRLRERVQAAKANDSANERWSAFHAFSCVVNWIDEERTRAAVEKGRSS